MGWGPFGDVRRIYGNVFDHHSVVYEYANGVRLYAFCRTTTGCYDEYSGYHSRVQRARQHHGVPDLGREQLALAGQRGSLPNRARQALCFDPLGQSHQQRRLHDPQHAHRHHGPDFMLYRQGNHLGTDQRRPNSLICPNPTIATTDGTARPAGPRGSYPVYVPGKTTLISDEHCLARIMRWSGCTLALALLLRKRCRRRVPRVPPPEASHECLLVPALTIPGTSGGRLRPRSRSFWSKIRRLKVTITENPRSPGHSKPRRLGRSCAPLHELGDTVAGPRGPRQPRKFVASGKGLMLVHFACGAWQDWPEFKALAGRVWDPKLAATRSSRAVHSAELPTREHPWLHRAGAI